MSMEPYPNRQFRFIDDPDRQSGSGSVPTRTRTWSDGPDPSLPLIEPKAPDCSYRLHTSLPFATHHGYWDMYLVTPGYLIHTVLLLTIAIGCIYLGHLRVDRHHLIKQWNTHCIFHSSWSHALLPSVHRATQVGWFVKHCCRAFIDPPNLCCSSHPGSLSHPLNHFLCSSSQSRSFARTWLLLNVTMQLHCVWLNPCDIGMIPSECTGPLPVRTSPLEIWTGPLPVQKALGLDRTKPGLVGWLLTLLPSLGSGAKTSSSCSGSISGSSSDLSIKLWLLL